MVGQIQAVVDLHVAGAKADGEFRDEQDDDGDAKTDAPKPRKTPADEDVEIKPKY